MLLGGEGPALDVRAQVVGPPQPAALATPVEPCNASARGRSPKSLQKRRANANGQVTHAPSSRAGSIEEQTEHVPAAGGPAAVRAQRPEAEADVHACMRGPAVNHFKSLWTKNTVSKLMDLGDTKRKLIDLKMQFQS